MSDCKGCPDVPYPSIELPRDTSLTQIGIEGLPGITNEPPNLQEGLTHTKIWSIYTGGSAEDHLIGILLTLPENFKRIQIHLDGALEYEKGLGDWEPPSPIDGYSCDSKNKWLFRPLWKSCKWRQYSTVVKDKCQCIEVIAKCTLGFNWVKFENCQQCEARMPIEPRYIFKRKTIENLHLPDFDRNSMSTKSDRA